MTTIINGSSPSVTFSDGTTQTTAGLPLTGGTVSGAVTVTGAITATGGVIQGANAAPCFSAYSGSGNAQSVTSGTWTKVILDTKEFDTNTNFSTTNYRFTPTVAGYYQINGCLSVAGTLTQAISAIYKNGTEYKRGTQITLPSGVNNAQGLPVSAVIYFNGSTDYVELWGILTGTGTIFNSSSTTVYLNGCFLRSA